MAIKAKNIGNINIFTKELVLLIPNSFAYFNLAMVEIINTIIRNKTINFILIYFTQETPNT